MATILIINETNRENATVKVLKHACGCKKHICMTKNDPMRKPCSISCDKCRDHGSYDPCEKHRTVSGFVRDRKVVSSEYFV